MSDDKRCPKCGRELPKRTPVGLLWGPDTCLEPGDADCLRAQLVQARRDLAEMKAMRDATCDTLDRFVTAENECRDALDQAQADLAECKRHLAAVVGATRGAHNYAEDCTQDDGQPDPTCKACAADGWLEKLDAARE